MARPRATDAEILAQLPAARERARRARTGPTRIVSATYDRDDDSLVAMRP